MSTAYIKWMNLRARIGGIFKFASAATSSMILIYEVLSGLHWLATREFFHNKTCRVFDFLGGTDYCASGFTASSSDVNKFINFILNADVFFGALILIGVFALLGSLFIHRER